MPEAPEPYVPQALDRQHTRRAYAPVPGRVEPPPASPRILQEACDEHGVLFVVDEITTAFGRTGTLSAAEHTGGGPDATRPARALTRGHLPPARTLSSTRGAKHISPRAAPALAHGPASLGNPLAGSAVNASIALSLFRDWSHKAKPIKAALQDGPAGTAAVPGTHDVRVLGAIGVVRLRHQAGRVAGWPPPQRRCAHAARLRSAR
ncbi:aminotransferase class III-fold pyridoxal phosphate-dependent enzyme [Streptomyces sp. NPDC000987]|uniref:aminotransferase class III-fold pyridoxal phosphate-dependent enzyme n=1 Tax=Streptomyces sp. NPDC000987 TaxID=3154374 RepID=UPI0033183C41